MRKSSIFGYDTRSLRSALVMAAVDAANPFKKQREFKWQGPVVVSSTAGLGDLFIHLPLISGIVEACRARRLKVAVALRPAHLHLGMRCGWDTFPFDNGLEEFFKRPTDLRLREFSRLVLRARQHAPHLWIDLTGSALSAVAVKAAGAKRIAARITRGGRSLVDYQLPHAAQENEYENRARVARYLGCELDRTIADRLRPMSKGPSNSVLLALTTASRWKSWPLENFHTLIGQFPNITFTVVGIRSEVPAEQRDVLDQIVRRSNVWDAMDLSSADELVDLVASSRAVISNDTSAAHIANLFRKPGAVLFGPVDPNTFAARDGLHVFHDRTCRFHPCVQWRCKNRANWCMQKISLAAVAAHLEEIVREDREVKASAAKPVQRPAYYPNRQWQPQLPV